LRLQPQVNGAVILNNTIAADNGAGPLQHVVNGKDNGAAAAFCCCSCSALLATSAAGFSSADSAGIPSHPMS
jgi:hypothetical protein